MNWYKIANIHPAYREFTKSPLFNALWNTRAAMASAAQKVYDEWQQDNEGMDEDLGAGGICQDIASAIANVVMSATNHNATTVSSACGEQHVWCIAYSATEAFHVDIPYNTYETGGGYSWKKKPDVKFDATYIAFEPAEVPDENNPYDY